MLDIIDTAGQEEFSAMRDQYMRVGEGFLLVFSLTTRGSFDELPPLREKILMVKDVVGYYPMVVIGNKCDLENEREVSKLDLENLGKNFQCPVFEGSAKARINVEEAFKQVVREIVKFNSKGTGDGKGTVKKPRKPLRCSLL